MSNLLSIRLKVNEKIYKLISVSHKYDKFGDNFYVIYPNKEWIKKTGGERIIPIKYSRHASGQNNRFTFGPSKNRFGQFKPEEKDPIDKLNQAEALSYLSLNDLYTIDKLLDEAKLESGYKDFFVIDTNNYKHLTIQLFLAKYDYPLSKCKFSYKTIQSFRYGDFQIIITTRDLWIDPKRYNKEQTRQLLNT